jgi:hypothetical protein
VITPIEAEELARKTLQEYVNSCRCDTVQDAGNVLMELISMAGLMMCATIGQQEAVARLEGTAAQIAKPEYGGMWLRETVN